MGHATHLALAAGAPDGPSRMASRSATIAVPVRNDARDVVAALNLSADALMISLEELVDALTPHLVSTADRISARLGYRRDDETN